MMGSWNGNTFHITAHFYKQSNGWWFLLLDSISFLNKQLSCQWFQMLWCSCNGIAPPWPYHYILTAMISLMTRLHFDLEISENFSRVTLNMYCYIRNLDNKILHSSKQLPEKDCRSRACNFTNGTIWTICGISVWNRNLIKSHWELKNQYDYRDNKVHGANMGPIWGWQDPGGPHVGHVNLALWVLCSGQNFRNIHWPSKKLWINDSLWDFNVRWILSELHIVGVNYIVVYLLIWIGNWLYSSVWTKFIIYITSFM